MAYPEPLEFDDSWTGLSAPIKASLRRTFRSGAIGKLILRDPDNTMLPVFLSASDRDALIDWLVSQREAERDSEQRASEAPETLPTGRIP